MERDAVDAGEVAGEHADAGGALRHPQAGGLVLAAGGEVVAGGTEFDLERVSHLTSVLKTAFLNIPCFGQLTHSFKILPATPATRVPYRRRGRSTSAATTA